MDDIKGLSHQDVIRILRTLYLFLESQNLKQTCKVLLEESRSNGYEVDVVGNAALTFRTSNISDSSKDDLCVFNTERVFLSRLVNTRTSFIMESSMFDEEIKTSICIYFNDSNESINSDQEKDKGSGEGCISGSASEHSKPPTPPPRNIKRSESNEYVEIQDPPSKTAAKTPKKPNVKLNVTTSNTTASSIKVRSKSDIQKISPKNSRNKLQRTVSKSAPNYENTKKSETKKTVDAKKSVSKSRVEQEPTKEPKCNIEGCLCTELSYQELRGKFVKLQEDHQRLMAVTSELTVALQSNILGQSENLSQMLSNCREIYPDLFTKAAQMKIDDALLPSYNSESETFEKSSILQSEDEKSDTNTTEICELDQKLDANESVGSAGSSETPKQKIEIKESGSSRSKTKPEDIAPTILISETKQNFLSRSASNECFELNFRKLKTDLVSNDINLKLRLLQALRWRITKSDASNRDMVIGSFIRHDLLSLHSTPCNGMKETFLESFLCPKDLKTPHLLQENMARLINSFASLTLGRDYLSQDDELLVSLLIPLTLGKHYSKVELSWRTKEMILATLQKMSLRQRQRLTMISAGLVEYLIVFLTSRHDDLSSYCLEYTTALFMNLCLHDEAREKCRAHAKSVVWLLGKLLSSQHLCCMPYINGALYSLLKDPVINKEARLAKMEKLLRYHIKHSTGEIQKQLQFILKVHLKGYDEDCICNSCDLQEEIDLLEPELDANDQNFNGAVGETLLQNYKLLFPIRGFQIPESFRCMCRPTTPLTRNSNRESPCPKASRVLVLESPGRQEDNEIEEMILEIEGLQDNENEDFEEREENVGGNLGEEQPIYSVVYSDESSPDRSFSEETKQFYHKPSAKRGIFANKTPRKIQKVPPSFTRTISNAPLCEPMSLKSTCPWTAADGRSFRVENTPPVVLNPPYAVDNFKDVKKCYKEPNCHSCAQRNKYSCQCYDVMKNFVDKTENESVIICMSLPPPQPQNSGRNSGRSSNKSQNQKRNCSPVSLIENETLDAPHDLDLDEEDVKEHSCPHEDGTECDCKCYRAVFKSRPKILRTP